MQEQEAREIINDLIQQAEAEDHVESKLISSWEEYRFYLQQERALKIVIKVLSACEKATFDVYCKEIVSGESDLNKLLACIQLQDVIAFYEQDLQTVKKMNTEYDDHLGNWGNFVKEFILGFERED